MYLSKIDLFGFKSFAIKTKIEFSDGITAIVGPNGCGKTNIVDGIRWVLGEQKVTVLRSEKMENIIFNGSATRKPMGLAEVSLYIENTKNILPIEYSEVVITRRLYRSGDSEYLLNGNQCRLKDIIDMFMDTGLSADAYSVIELKMVESILSDRTEERRKLFEEAAGVSKFKNRKIATLRKLESVRQDLIRINDIIREVERKVNSLKRQASRAKRYSKIKNDIRDKEIKILKFNYSNLKNVLRPQEKELQTLKNFIEKSKSEQTILESDIEKLRYEQIEKEKEYEKTQKEYSEISDKLRELETGLNTLKERKNFTMNKIKYLNDDVTQIKVKMQNIKSNISELENSKKIYEQKSNKLNIEYKKSKERFNKLISEYNEFKENFDNLRNENLNTFKLLNEKERTKDKIHRDFSEREEKLNRIGEETSRLKKRMHKRKEELEGLIQQKLEKEKILQKTDRENQEIEDDISSRNKESNEVQEKIYKYKIQLENSKAKLEFLNNLIQNLSGSSEGEKYLLQKREEVVGLHGTVAELIDVDNKYKKAIETSLGETASYLIFDTLESAKTAISELKKKNGGKATIIPLDRMKNVKLRDRVFNYPKNDIVYGWANDLIEINQEYKKTLDFLLEDVLVVKDSEKAFQTLNFDFKKDLKFVDINGDMVKGDGVIRGGSVFEKKEDTIGKGKEIKELKLKIKNLEKNIYKLKEKRKTLDSEVEKLKEKKAEKERYDIEVKKVFKDIEKEIIVLENEIKRDNDFLNEISGEKDQLELFKMDETDLVKLNNEIINIHQKKEEIEEELRKHQQEEAVWEDRKKDVQDQLHKKELETIKNEDTLKNTFKEIDRLNNEIVTLAQEKKEKEDEINNLNEDIVNIEEEINKTENSLMELFDVHKKFENEINAKRNIYVDKKNEVDEKEKVLKENRNKLNQAIDNVFKLETDISENKTDLEIIQRKMNEYGITDYSIDEDVDIKELENEVLELKIKIERIGPVNLLAEEDYNEEKERLDFLQKQKEDIVGAEKNLIETIEKINEAAIDQFNDTFEEIRKNFKEIYNIFFEKGEADLRLINDNEPLESPIGIISRPFGKKLLSTNQLSTGEKALTAIALLFGIYKVKPSPFCILDEVDAPLDETNTDRFLKALDIFSDDTQFIIVTHNKRTMEKADSLFGVTMEEPGVSKVLSVKFD